VTIANQNVTIYRGDSKLLFIELTNADDGTPFVPGAAAEIKYRIAFNASEIRQPLVFKTLGSGVAQVPGGVNIALSPDDTNLFPRQYYHELKIEDLGDVMTAMTGVVWVRPSLQPYVFGTMGVTATATMATTASVI
jgi:hypothetical protein